MNICFCALNIPQLCAVKNNLKYRTHQILAEVLPVLADNGERPPSGYWQQ